MQCHLLASKLKDREDLDEIEVESEFEIEDLDEDEERSEDEESDGGGEGGLSGRVLPFSGAGKSGFLADRLCFVG